MEFKDFLLNENRAYLGQRVGDVLNAIEDLDENGKSMGTRQVTRNAEGIVNQIRRILHSNWPKTEEKTLKKLQKIAVAIARALDPERKKEEGDDIYAIVASAKSEIEQLSGKLGVPINTTSKEKDQEPDEAQDSGEQIKTAAPQPQPGGAPSSPALGAPSPGPAIPGM